MSKRVFQYFLVFVAALGLNLSVDTSDSFLQKGIASFSAIDNYPKLHLPIESAPVPIDREVPNENELEEDFDDDVNSSVGYNSHESTTTTSSVRNVFPRITYSKQNRSTVPLFILYSSWKSYLS